MKDGWYYLDVKSACGGVKIEEGHVVECAPYFNSLKHWSKRDVFFLITQSRHVYLGQDSHDNKKRFAESR